LLSFRLSYLLMSMVILPIKHKNLCRYFFKNLPVQNLVPSISDMVIEYNPFASSPSPDMLTGLPVKVWLDDRCNRPLTSCIVIERRCERVAGTWKYITS